MKTHFLLMLLVLPAVLFTFDNGLRAMAHAEDEIEDELIVEGENDNEADGENEEVAVTEDEDDEAAAARSTSSPDADTTILFTRPVTAGASQLELPAGHPVEFLVGLRNRGKQPFTVDSLEASFRYPMDFNFYIQNFSAIALQRPVAPGQEATFMYSFLVSEAFAGRPFGLNVNLNYRDGAGAAFQEAVYNETVQIVELEEGLDGETFFLYVFLAAGVVLLLVVGQQFLSSLGRKRTGRKAAVETGTSNPNNVDYDWLPKQTLQQINKSLEKSPRANKNQKSPKQNAKQVAKQVTKQQSPRQRKVKRAAGSDD